MKKIDYYEVRSEITDKNGKVIQSVPFAKLENLCMKEAKKYAREYGEGSPCGVYAVYDDDTIEKICSVDIQGAEIMYKTYAVMYHNLDLNTVGADRFYEKSVADARSAFRECYRHHHYKILAVVEIPETEKEGI